MSFNRIIFNIFNKNKSRINLNTINFVRKDPFCVQRYKTLTKPVIPSHNNHFINTKFYNQNYYLKDFPKCFILAGIFGYFTKEKDEENPVVTLLKRSLLLIQKGEYDKAEQMLHLALKTAQEQQNFEGVTYAYDVLANLAYDQEQYKKAEKLFKSVLQRMISTGTPQDDIKVINISLKLANIYNELNDEKALPGYVFCYNLLKKKYEDGIKDDDTLFLWAITLHNYGKFLQKKNQWKDALNMLIRAQEISLNLFGKKHEMNALLLNDMGSIHYFMNNLDESLNYLQESLEISNEVPEEMPEKAEILMNICLVFKEKKLNKEAISYCKQALQVAKKFKNEKVIVEAKKVLDELKNANRI